MVNHNDQIIIYRQISSKSYNSSQDKKLCDIQYTDFGTQEIKLENPNSILLCSTYIHSAIFKYL